MKRNFTFSKFRIINQKYNLNFMDTFCTKDKNYKQKNNILLKNKIKIIPVLKIDKPKNENINNKNKTISENIDNNYNPEPDTFNGFSSPKKNQKINIIKNDINNVMINSKKSDKFYSPNRKKIKLSIPINKTQIKPFHNLNQNYIININNNINNSYQIKMQNNSEMNKDINNINNYEFEKMKVLKSEDGIKNYNTSNQKTALSELSDLSRFKSNKKIFNLNTIINIVKYNSKPEKQNINNIYNNNDNKKKKIYINPVDFQKFCQEIEEKLNF